MKIRATTELVDFLDQTLAWRRKEITSLHFCIQRANRDHERKTLIRAAIPILYAHWEGFSKRACEAYLELVSRRGLPYEQLKTNFLAIASKGAIREAGQSNQMQLYLNVIEFATFNQGNMGNFTFNGSIDAEDNLSSRVFRNLLTTLGFVCDDYFASRFLLLDGSLLKWRNEIAHGERTQASDPDYDQLHHLVIQLVDHLKTLLENSAVTESYRRQ